uniref:Uncharacterized protein n=1 Tax=Utricularia reniformis TaxID=192314 RepID=A0A1Y0B293_9LAMI|nr:hypothetical protein AEK19_MT1368 [Utricularia reniformis]ART31566.1 hypothetical protein AEK19_MT1368 [Utricularia reniformis]
MKKYTYERSGFSLSKVELIVQQRNGVVKHWVFSCLPSASYYTWLFSGDAPSLYAAFAV